LTLSGTILGTVGYMSPEQAEAKPVDARSDIFSFGVVLYEMLSGRRAFTGDSMVAVMAAVLRLEPEPLDAPDNLRRVVARCLCKSPGGRYQSVAELRDALHTSAASNARDRRPSIAVLPFANMSRDVDDEYFSDGLAEEIINALVKIPGLKVIARTSAFAFKGQNTDIRRIADVLGVANILEGSVRRAGNRIRVTAQLITAADGSHLWSERYDRQMEDLFAMQDEIAAAIASELKVQFAVTPAARVRRQPDLQAYEAYLRYWSTNGPLRPRRSNAAVSASSRRLPSIPNSRCPMSASRITISRP
jgi:serine/threonine-protein kinase